MLTRVQIDFLNRVCTDKWTETNGVISVNGNVDMSRMNLTQIPVQFGHIKGNFYCHYNKLTTLKGAPIIIDGGFVCESNQLTTLEGGPKDVVGLYSCSCNKLTNLIGAPEICNGNFYCSNNKLTSLEGGPKSIRGLYSCSNNKLTNLIGAPKICNDNFYCNMNQLTSLEDCPKVIKGNLHCQNNPDLKYLWGIGRVENEVYYENELNEWIIECARKNIIFPYFTLEENINWIKNIGQYSCLLKAPQKILRHFSPKILHLVDYGIC